MTFALLALLTTADPAAKPDPEAAAEAARHQQRVATRNELGAVFMGLGLLGVGGGLFWLSRRKTDG